MIDLDWNGERATFGLRNTPSTLHHNAATKRTASCTRAQQSSGAERHAIFLDGAFLLLVVFGDLETATR